MLLSPLVFPSKYTRGEVPSPLNRFSCRAASFLPDMAGLIACLQGVLVECYQSLLFRLQCCVDSSIVHGDSWHGTLTLVIALSAKFGLVSVHVIVHQRLLRK